MAGNSMVHKLLVLWINKSSLNILLTHYMALVLRLHYPAHIYWHYSLHTTELQQQYTNI